MNARALIVAAGAALILVSNGVVLGGVAYNRSGEPESRLSLSQRELGRPWNSYDNKENSGLSLTLQWRVIDRAAASVDSYHDSRGGNPAWLDEKRMAELGFDVARAKGSRREKYVGISDRQVLVVLELAGAAWQQALERARQALAHQESLRRASPDAKELIEAEKRAREALAREENDNSRLFAVDVGTDLAALRTKYSDRGRFLILKGRLHLDAVTIDTKPTVSGYLDELSVHRINVPHALRGAFGAMPARERNSTYNAPPFIAIVAMGQRLEPWIETVTTP